MIKIRIHKFIIISGLCWILDIAITYILIEAGAQVFVSNMIGATFAVILVFITSQYHVFYTEGRISICNFMKYCIFQSVTVPTASYIIQMIYLTMLDDNISHFLRVFLGIGVILPNSLTAIVAKIILTPITLFINYVFMGWILEKKISLY